MSIYLYVKTHNKTGLKYLGKTSSLDPYSYSGSGTRWLNHLKKHGYDFQTEIIRECQTEEELKEWGLHYSNLWNVAESNEWANLKSEEGQGGKHNQETKKRLSEIKKEQYALGKLKPWNKGKTGIYSQETRSKISEANKKRKHSKKTKLKMSLANRSSYQRTASVSDETKKKLSEARKGKPSPTKGYRWTIEQKQNLTESRKGRVCPTKGMKRVYREDGTFYFEKPIN
jgi:hypothetical protein